LPFGEQVNMQVRHRLAGMRTVVYDEAKAIGELQLSGNHARGQEEMTEQRLVVGLGLADARDDLLGNDEQVYGRLRLDIVQDQAVLVLVLDSRRNLARDDSFEDGFHGDGGMKQDLADAGNPLSALPSAIQRRARARS